MFIPENPEEEYREEVLSCVQDEDNTPGIIDDKERFYLDKIATKWKIPPEIAKMIEEEVISTFQAPDCELVYAETVLKSKKNLTDIDSFEEDMKRYGKIKKFTMLSITHIFNEGKTGAKVFKIKGLEKNGKKKSRILKYDFFPKVHKEYSNFKDHEDALEGIIAPAKMSYYEGTGLSKYGILELKPADEFANAYEMVSLRSIIDERMTLLKKDFHSKQSVTEPIHKVLGFLFHRVYSNQKYSTLYQNSIDHFLPPRKSSEDKAATLLLMGNSKPEKGYTFIEKQNIVDYNIRISPGALNKRAILDFKIQLPVNNPGEEKKFERIDVSVEVDRHITLNLMKRSNWNLYINTSVLNQHRNLYYNQISDQIAKLIPKEKFKEYELSPILEKGIGSSFYIDTLLNQKGSVITTTCLHGDLNPSNILLCRVKVLDTFKYEPILIDFYDTGISGNIFFDVARLETEINIELLSKVLRSYGITDDTESLNEESIRTILEFEEKLFYFDRNTSLFDGDFISFEIRQAIKKNAVDIDPEYNNLDWYKNFILAAGVFALRFPNFSRETNLNKLISIILAHRLFYRFENFETLKAKLNIQEKQEIIKFGSPLEEFIKTCRRASRKVREELGIEAIPIELFQNYYSREENYFNKFLQQSRLNCLLIEGESWTGKSAFLDLFLFNSENSYPILYISGMDKIKNPKNYFEEEVKNLLGEEFNTHDWLLKIDFLIKEDSKLFCIIIENLYYNPDPELAIEALESFLSKLSNSNSKIKVIITTNSSFYNEFIDTSSNIKSFLYPITEIVNGKEVDLNSLVIQSPSPVEGEKMVEAYFKYYHITAEPIGNAKNIYKVPGILKYFCEVKKVTNPIVGKFDHIFIPDLVKEFVDRKLKEISKFSNLHIEKIEKIMLDVSNHLLKKDSNQIETEAIQKICLSAGLVETQISGLLHYCIQTGIFYKIGIDYRFRFPEIPGFIIAGSIVDNHPNYMEVSGKHWTFFDNLLRTMRQKPIHEIIAYYILALSYNKDPKRELFVSVLKKMNSYEKSIYSLLRIFSRAISTLPHQNYEILKFINKLEEELKDKKNKANDRMLEKSYQNSFQLLDQNIVFNKRAIRYTGLFEKAIYKKDVKDLLSIFRKDDSMFNWNEFSSFLKEDYSKNSNFIRNYIESSLKLIHNNILNNETSIVKLCEQLLVLSKRSEYKFGKFEIEVYDLLFGIINTHEANYVQRYKDKAIDLIVDRNIADKELFESVANKIYQIDKKEPNKFYWLKFLMQYKDFDSDIGIISYEQLERLSNSLDYENLDGNTKSELRQYIKESPKELMIPVIKKIYPRIKRDADKNSFDKIITEVTSVKVETQKVIFFILKKDDSLLLRYNESWKDYNWIGGQVNSQSSSSKDEISQAREIIEDKLKLSQGEYELKLFSSSIGYEKYSKKRKKYVRYQTSLYFLSIKEKFILKEIERDKLVKAFSWEELTLPVNTSISSAVRNIIFKINQEERLYNIYKLFKNDYEKDRRNQ